MDLVSLREEKINLLKNQEEVILTDIDLQLLMYDGNNREDNGNYSDIIWFKIFRNIASKNKRTYEVINSVQLSESELLLMNLIDNNLDELYNTYNKILNSSKGTIGIKLDKDEINYLINIISNNKPSEDENEDYYNALKENYKIKKYSNDNVIYHKF